MSDPEQRSGAGDASAADAPSVSECPPENDIAEFAIGTRDAVRGARVLAHLDGCATCRALVAEAAASQVGGDVPARSPMYRPLPRLEPGQAIGRYVVDGWLGHGGMGAVYRAHDSMLLREVALKVVAVPSEGESGVRRWMREARAVAALQHPNIVSVFDVGEASGTAFLAMELVVGETLRRRMSKGAVPRETAVAWLIAIASALAAAHARGLVHRDVKPENVMIRADGTVKVLDFGLARWIETPASELGESLTKDGALVGTPAYMAPEQLRGETLDGRADQFAWGVVAYELLARRAPWQAKGGAYAIASEILTRAPPALRELAPEVDAHLEAIVARALGKSAEERFGSMNELLAAIEGRSAIAPIVAKEETAAASDAKARDARATGSRSRALAKAIGAATVAGLLGWGAVLVVRARTAAAEEARIADDLNGSAPRLEASIHAMLDAPLHDTRRERLAIEADVQRIKGEIVRMPSRAAQGAFGIGRARLAMHDAAGSLPWIERAAAAGPPNADVELAWGEALAALYRSSSIDAQRLPTALREAKVAELVSALRDPALAHFRAAKDLGSTRALTPAIVLLCQGRFDEAIRAAKNVARASEAKELEGDAEYDAADAMRALGRSEDADQGYARAEAAYGAAIELAPSDAALYEKEGTTHARHMEITATRVSALNELHARALASIDRALVANPESAGAFRARSETASRFATHLSTHGESAAAEYVVAVEAGREAVRLAPNDADAHAALADALDRRGGDEMRRGVDPTASFEEAIAERVSMVKRAPTDASSWYALGTAREALAAHRGEQGLDPDPRPGLRQAIDAYEHASAQNRSWEAPLVGLGDALCEVAGAERARGVDAAPTLDRAAANADRIAMIAPESTIPLIARAHVALARAEAKLARNEDAATSLLEAQTLLGEARSRDHGDARSLRLFGRVRLAGADDDRIHGRDPTAALEDARRALTESLVVEPASPEASRETAETWEKAALDAIAHGRDARSPLDLAEKALAHALSLRPQDNGAIASAARVSMLRARAAIAAHETDAAPRLDAARRRIDALLAEAPLSMDALRTLGAIQAVRVAIAVDQRTDPAEPAREGIEACDRADAIVAGDASVSANRGALKLGLARASHVAAESQRLASEALAHFDAAIGRDARLGPDLVTLRNEAHRLARR